MAAFNQGDKVIINGRAEWPQPPGYQFTGAEGMVERWVQYAEPLEGFSEFILVRLQKAEGRAAPYVGGGFFFRADDLTKVVSLSEAGL
jgi:hypothetical protein